MEEKKNNRTKLRWEAPRLIVFADYEQLEGGDIRNRTEGQLIKQGSHGTFVAGQTITAAGNVITFDVNVGSHRSGNHFHKGVS